jgi:flagellum-specific peptidoglycan hydrolase FlgJ
MTKAEATFIASVAPAAQLSQQQTGIPACITIAQAILESGWGKTKLAIEDHNYFGIKAIPGQNYCEFATAEYLNGKKEVVEARFARYASAADSFRAHTYLLSHSKRYEPAMQRTTNATAFALALQSCGYSTSPLYATELMDLVAEFNLTQYDSPPVPPIEPAKAAAA